MSSKPQSWPNIPAHIETFVHPHLPSFTRDVRRFFVLCRGNEAAIRKHLSATPFEYVSDLLMIEVADFANRTYPASPGETWGFMDCTICVQAKYRDRVGGYILFEYEDQDYSIFAGREMWGYPKTYGTVTLEEKSQAVHAGVMKSGQELVRLQGHLDQSMDAMPSASFSPVFNVYTIPNADGPGIFSQRIISRDTSPGFQPKSKRFMQASVTLASIRQHPLAELGPLEVLGASLQVGDYEMNDEYGWGVVEETLV